MQKFLSIVALLISFKTHAMLTQVRRAIPAGRLLIETRHMSAMKRFKQERKLMLKRTREELGIKALEHKIRCSGKAAQFTPTEEFKWGKYCNKLEQLKEKKREAKIATRYEKYIKALKKEIIRLKLLNKPDSES